MRIIWNNMSMKSAIQGPELSRYLTGLQLDQVLYMQLWMSG